MWHIDISEMNETLWVQLDCIKSLRLVGNQEVAMIL